MTNSETGARKPFATWVSSWMRHSDFVIRLLPAVAVFGSFLAYSLIQAPIPAPNEPHYLSKAKHYWNPDFCPRDFFLESSNPHLVFYQTVGLLTLWLSLPQTAFVARVIAYGLLAAGWTSCVGRLTHSRAAPVWAAGVFLAMATVGNLSGEWMIGGVEAKVFSYAFVVLAIARLFDRRWRSAGIFAGLAVSFHPVVGGWAVVAGGLATTVTWYLQRCGGQRSEVGGRSLAEGGGWKAEGGQAPLALNSQLSTLNLSTTHHSPLTTHSLLLAVLLGVLCALPGIVPAVNLVMLERTKSAASANMIQVFERLGHHLDPRRFRTVEIGGYEVPAAWLGYAVLGLLAIGLLWRLPRTRERTWFGWFVVATAVIALGGLAVGLIPRLPDGRPDTGAAWFDLRLSLMKFYPFRLADVFVPAAVAVAFVAVFEARPVAWNKFHATQWAVFAGLLAFAVLRPIADRNPSHMTPDEFADWRAACRWIDANLPPDAVVLTPPSSSWGFKWYAQRAEYVSRKDCPQDVAGILEWERRLRYVNMWGGQNTHFRDPTGYTKAALRKLSEEGITHILMDAHVPFEIRPVYPRGSQKNASFRVYRLKDAFTE